MNKDIPAQAQYNRADFYGIEYVTNCTECSRSTWYSLMDGAIKANKAKITALVKKYEPELAERLALNYYNPYGAMRTKTHLILVHSSIEYFFKIKDSR